MAVVEFAEVVIPVGYIVFLDNGIDTDVGNLSLTDLISKVTGSVSSLDSKNRSIEVANIPVGCSTAKSCARGFA